MSSTAVSGSSQMRYVDSLTAAVRSARMRAQMYSRSSFTADGYLLLPEPDGGALETGIREGPGAPDYTPRFAPSAKRRAACDRIWRENQAESRRLYLVALAAPDPS